MKREVSKKKAQQIEKFRNSKLKVSESIYVSIELCKNNYQFNKNDQYEILEINGEELTVVRRGYSSRETPKKINIKDVRERFGVYNIGADPFNRKFQSVRPVAYQMESIIHNLELEEIKRDKPYEINGITTSEVNWNPFIYDKDGNKEYYQRDFVWTEKEEKLLIESIYKGIGCGTILIRKRSWEELEKMAANGETELSFNDIVDGKQRLNTIKRFINNEIVDSYGNYFSDLSNRAQNDFTNHQLFSYAEMSDVTDEEVIYQFLKLNHAGIPQSQEHIDFVSNLLDKM